MGDSVLSGGEGIDAERYYTIKEAARLLRRCEKTLWMWTVDGKIQYHQPAPGHKILIPGSEIKRLNTN